jgi:lysophospholipase L1-like esterase
MKIFSTLLFALLTLGLFAQIPDPDPYRFDAAMERFQGQDENRSSLDTDVVFTGSSSIRMWDLETGFPERTILNRGFGGSHISDVIHFLDQTTLRYNPKVVALYAGDNDVAAEKTAEQVFDDYLEFCSLLLEAHPDVQIIYVAIKPSLARWSVWPQMEDANTIIAEYISQQPNQHYLDVASPMVIDGQPDPDLFIEDGLHMNRKGYLLWEGLMNELLTELGF